MSDASRWTVGQAKQAVDDCFFDMTNRGPAAGLDRYGEVIGLLKTAVQAGREDLANELARALLNKGKNMPYWESSLWPICASPSPP